MGALRILHTNDLHGRLDAPRVETLESVRAACDLYFDSGDGVACGNLGMPLGGPDPYWAGLARLNCTASTLGNRESHLLEGVFRTKLAGAAQPLVVANLHHKRGGLVLAATHTLTCQGLRVGLVGGMVAMVTERMRARAVSEFLWTAPIPAIAEAAKALRPQVDLLLALTHIGLPQDRRLAEAAPEIDGILGGHSHDVLHEPEHVGRTWISQAGSHGRFFADLTLSPQGDLVDYRLAPWPGG